MILSFFFLAVAVVPFDDSSGVSISMLDPSSSASGGFFAPRRVVTMINQTAAKLSLIIFELRFWPIKCMQKHPENLLKECSRMSQSMVE